MKEQACNLISLVANAIFTETQEEAIDYLNDHAFMFDPDLLAHSVEILNNCKQQ